MAIIVSDSFNRPDNPNSLGTADTGQRWTVYGNAVYGIQNNQAYQVTGASDGQFAGIEVNKSDVEMEINFSVIDASPYCVVRASDNSHYIQIQAKSGYEVYEYDGGWALIASIPVTPSSGDRINIKASGNNYEVTINGGNKTTFTSTFNRTAKIFGVSGISGSSRFDDFRIKSMSAGSTIIDSGPITLPAIGTQSAQPTRLRSTQASIIGISDIQSDIQTQAVSQITSSAALHGTSKLAVQAGNMMVVTGSVSMSAVGSVAAKAQRIVHERVDMGGASGLSASPTRLISSEAGFMSTASLSTQGTAIIAIDADLVASGAMQAVIGAELVGTVELEGQRELHVYLVGKRELNVNLKGVI